MIKTIKILVLALLLPVSANADDNLTKEQRAELSEKVMLWGEIIYSGSKIYIVGYKE